MIRPGHSEEIIFDDIQHKLVTSLHFTLGGDDMISPFNGKIGFVGVYLGEGAYHKGLNFDVKF